MGQEFQKISERFRSKGDSIFRDPPWREGSITTLEYPPPSGLVVANDRANAGKAK